MAYLNDRVLDFGLNVLDIEATALHICSAEPSTYVQATTTYNLGAKSGISIGAPGAHSGGGREVTVTAITDGAITATGTATHYAIVDVPNTRLLAAGPLPDSQAVTSGNPFTLAAATVFIPGVA